jgi:ABC-type Fe3+-hydroxamate transport system substrate-binding protein
MIRLAGLRNAAAESGIEGHSSLDFERLIEIDPDVIVVSRPATGEEGSATREILVSTPALARIAAVREGRIAVLSAALLSADSPRLVDAAEALADEVDRMPPPSRE